MIDITIHNFLRDGPKYPAPVTEFLDHIQQYKTELDSLLMRGAILPDFHSDLWKALTSREVEIYRDTFWPAVPCPLWPACFVFEEAHTLWEHITKLSVEPVDRESPISLSTVKCLIEETTLRHCRYWRGQGKLPDRLWPKEANADYLSYSFGGRQ